VSDPEIDRMVDQAKIETDEAKRDKLLRDGLVRTRDQYYYVPLHHQMRPWAMKKNVTITYSPDDRPTARFANVK
jgi:peptide/nickel transport system substrate-binding protein